RYDSAELGGPQVEALVGYFAVALAAMDRDSSARSEIETLLSPAERHQIVSEWNDRGVDALALPFHRLFEAQVERRPDAVALVSAGCALSYAELNARANRWAHRLRREGVGPDLPVALAAERSAEMVVGALAVLKAGGAYVPLDPTHPRQRLESVLEDLGRPLLLATGRAADDLGHRARRTLRLDEPLGEGRTSNPREIVALDNLAYVIFTSGSTGRPKGVGITHRSLVNFLGSMSRRPGLGERDVLLAVTTFSFDIAGLELFLPLLVGARVVIAPRESTIDPEALALLAQEATVLQATPATWRLLLESGW